MDKLTCTDGYVIDNVVSCCEICNFMKGTLTPEIFFKKIEHILTFNNVIDGELHEDCFMNHNTCGYKDYNRRAMNKNIAFEITKDEFNEIKEKDCYLCGKKNSNIHKNGVDRINNELGYIISNVKSCCGDCNYMKNKFDLNVIKEKMLLIYNNLKNYKFDINSIQIMNHLNKHLNKKSSEEKVKSLNNKRILQKEITKQKYNDDEYKLNRAKELALLRK